MTDARPGPLDGVVVLDVTRMLPGAVLARMLVDVGARVIKIEDPAGGDPMRLAAPQVDSIGAAFCGFFRGVESVCLNLREPSGAAALRKLARHADVLAESFRPGTLEGWGVGPERLRSANPSLVICSLSGFGCETDRVGHDLNFAAASGILSLLPGDGIPRIQLADVSTGLLASTAVMAALLGRARTGTGCHIDQPLVAGPLPFLTLALAETAAGGGGLLDGVLAGNCPAYRLYRCGDGLRIAVCLLEPKFWIEWVEALGLPDLAGSGLETGEGSRDAIRRVEERIAGRPREHWLALATERNLPVSADHDLDSAASELPARFLERAPTQGGGGLSVPGPFLPSLGRSPSRPAPRLGEHTESVLREFGVESSGVA
jgi:crotonobetainyl-CoA:carnitine CoA-transferase CaiB-like acyl-CoA transferase